MIPLSVAVIAVSVRTTCPRASYPYLVSLASAELAFAATTACDAARHALVVSTPPWSPASAPSDTRTS